MAAGEMVCRDGACLPTRRAILHNTNGEEMTRRAFLYIQYLVYIVVMHRNFLIRPEVSSVNPEILLMVHFSNYTRKPNGFYRFTLFDRFEFSRFQKIDVAQTLAGYTGELGPLLKLRPHSK